jgi:Bifunctional DNA primase/polymerase, N-terminal
MRELFSRQGVADKGLPDTRDYAARGATQAALEYAQLGLRVIPVQDKRPLVPLDGVRVEYTRWPDRATSDPKTVRRWYDLRPDLGVGVVIGNSFIDLDVDVRHGGGDSLADLERRLGSLPGTPRFLGRGPDDSFHVLLAHTDVPLIGEPAPGLSIRRGRLMVVMPPTPHHQTGRPREWEIDLDEAPFAALPETWIERLRDRPRPPSLGSGDDEDFLANRPPAEYVQLLTGVEVPSDGKIRCPAPDHDDSMPCCHIYKTGKEGFYCFGCKRGGDIYQFAAMLAGLPLPLRGTDFLRVQEGLFAIYEARLLR